MKKKLFGSLCLLATLIHYPFHTAWAEAYGSGWYGETQFSVGREDNISRSHKKEDLVRKTWWLTPSHPLASGPAIEKKSASPVN